MPLAFIASLSSAWGGQLGGVQFVGRQDETTLAVDESLTGRDPMMPAPLRYSRPPDQVAALRPVAPAWPSRGRGAERSLCGQKRGSVSRAQRSPAPAARRLHRQRSSGTSRLHALTSCSLCLSNCLFDRALCLRPALLGGDEHPTLRSPHHRSTSRRDRDSHPAAGAMVCGSAWARAACASLKVAGTRVIHLIRRVCREPLEVVLAIEGAISDQIGGAVGGVQLGRCVPGRSGRRLAHHWLLPLSGFMSTGIPAWCSTINSSMTWLRSGR